MRKVSALEEVVLVIVMLAVICAWYFISILGTASRIARMAKPEFTCSVSVQYLPEQSEPDNARYAFAYTVTIANTGDVTAQLIARRWVIADAQGQSHEVRGLAVVGQQPMLKPGEQFEYTSWTPLPTPQGTMRGIFYCMTDDARSFEATVHEFMLARPNALH